MHGIYLNNRDPFCRVHCLCFEFLKKMLLFNYLNVDPRENLQYFLYCTLNCCIIGKEILLRVIIIECIIIILVFPNVLWFAELADF